MPACFPQATQQTRHSRLAHGRLQWWHRHSSSSRPQQAATCLQLALPLRRVSAGPFWRGQAARALEGHGPCHQPGHIPAFSLWALQGCLHRLSAAVTLNTERHDDQHSDSQAEPAASERGRLPRGGQQPEGGGSSPWRSLREMSSHDSQGLERPAFCLLFPRVRLAQT